jgi:hypothetical protein
MGLHTGAVIVGAIGDNLRMDYTAVGDTTNVASRLQNVAAPGQVAISETTHRLVAGYCTTRPLGEHALKGKTEPIDVWEVLATQETRTRLEVEAERGLTPFVGRQRELQLLTDCFAQVETGQGQIAFLVGEAGLGKSRLLLEFRRRTESAATTWLEGHAMSFDQSMAFHPLIDLLRRNFRIEEDEAGHWLRQALSLALEVGNPPQLWKTHLALGRLHTETRRPEQAQQAYQAARQVIDRVKTNLSAPELLACLACSPLIRQVYDLSASG